jgi:phosphatidylglycerophosphate synthase
VGRLLVLAGAAVTDLLDGRVARRFGASRLGAFLDPVADKLFVGAAFLVVLLSGALTPLEIIGVLLRDLLAAVAFVVTLVSGRPSAIQARLGGKVVTVGQLVTLLLFLVGSPYLRPMAWATAAVGLYAIWDYHRVAPRAAHRLDR